MRSIPFCCLSFSKFLYFGFISNAIFRDDFPSSKTFIISDPESSSTANRFINKCPILEGVISGWSTYDIWTYLDRPVIRFALIYGPSCDEVCTHKWTTPISASSLGSINKTIFCINFAIFSLLLKTIA